MSKTNNAFINRRKFPRRHFPKNLSIIVNGDYSITKGVEIGEGGISFITDMEFPKEKPLVINFQIPGGSFVSVISEVKNFFTSDGGENSHGCEFKNIRFDVKREIRLFVSAREN